MSPAAEFCNPQSAIRNMAWAALPILMALSGCGDHRDKIGTPPASAAQALERINANADQVKGPLYAKVNVSLRFRDEKGKAHRLLNQDGYLAFQAPQCLRLDLKSLSGVIGQLGSNSERYWVWIEPEINTLWWGRWANASHASSDRLPISPTDLLETLLLSRLPEALPGGGPPELRIKSADQRLIYSRAGAGAGKGGTRDIRLLPGPPYLPTEIVDRDAHGEIWMRAELSNFDRIGRDGPYMPRKYRLTWPRNNAEMRIDVSGAKFRPDLENFCEFPSEWSGQVEAIDAP